MKYTINGYSQKKLLELSTEKYQLDYIDTGIIRYIADMIATDKMIKENYNNEIYYWIKYENIIKEMPIFRIITKNGLYKRLQKYIELGLIKHYTKKEKGTYSFYKFTEKYYDLLFDYQEEEIINKKDKSSLSSKINPSIHQDRPSLSASIDQNINLLNNINLEKKENNDSEESFSISENIYEAKKATVFNNKEKEDRILYQHIKKEFEIKEASIFNYAREGKAINQLIIKSKTDHIKKISPGGRIDFLTEMINTFYILKETSKEEIWKNQPFLPSRLNSDGIWNMVFEKLKQNKEKEKKKKEEKILIEKIVGHKI